jgi:glycosyltransferase involved in cell wall biosynthesis
MKILYVATQDDPRDMNSGSGADYEFYRAFVENGAEVQLIGPFADRASLLERAYRKAHRLFSRRRYAKRSTGFMRKIGAAVDEAIAAQSPDLIFSISTTGLACCPDTVPLVSRLDTSLKGHHDQYPIFSELEYRRMMGWEKKALRKVSLVITYSKWSASILTNYYHVPASKILVIPVPASAPEQVTPRILQIEPREMQPLHLLLVGRDYNRKGVDIAIQVVELLNSQGVAAELHIVGLQGVTAAHVRFMGLFRKHLESERQAYVEQYRWAHFLLHPARFEAGGIAVSEAAAFGLPTITNAAGGLATTVKDRISGIVLPAASPARAYVAAIRTYLDDTGSYLALRRSTRQRYEAELNWHVAGQKIFSALQQVVETRR